MGIKDAFFRILNKNVNTELQKSAEVAEEAVVKAEQPEIEKVEEIVEPVVETPVEPQIQEEENKAVDETTGISVITGEPAQELEEEPAANEDEVIDGSVVEEIHTEEPQLEEEVIENTAETTEIEQPVEITTEEVNASEEVNEAVESTVEEQTEEQDNKTECETKDHINVDVLTLEIIEDAVVAGIHAVFSTIIAKISEDK